MVRLVFWLVGSRVLVSGAAIHVVFWLVGSRVLVSGAASVLFSGL